MTIDQKTKVSFDFSPETHFLVRSNDDRFGDGESMVWTLNPRIDRSYKGKDDDVGIPEIYISDFDAEECKKLGFSFIKG